MGADHGFGYRKHQLGYFFPVPAENGSVILFHHMQDDIFVGFVCRVAVRQPVRRFLVYLHTAGPYGSVDSDFRIEEIGPGIGVLQAGINNLECIALCRGEARRPIQPVFPDVMK